ncbi:Exosome component 10 [Apodemus speciosus]|uniref:Exosome component 10 n=1 Tax=Apodemus speciosus TaxID=105296 RepID=A0ABQ0EQQ5_APOSI
MLAARECWKPLRRATSGHEALLFDMSQVGQNGLELSETAAGVKKSGPLPIAERLENDLFGPHDCSHAPPDNYPITPTSGTVPPQKQPSLFTEGKEETSVDAECLLATAVITLFSVFLQREDLTAGRDDSGEPSTEKIGRTPLTVAQKKAQNIMQSFENPFRMFLPSLEHKAHISQAAKFDPSSKIYEISNRWKLASQVQVHKAPKEATKKKAAEQTAAREEAEEAAAAVLEQAIPVRQQAALENATRKRERATGDLRATEQRQEKKRLKGAKKAKDPDPPGKDFSPYDYSQSDFGAFAGDSKSKPSSQFDPNKLAPSGKDVFQSSLGPSPLFLSQPKCAGAKKFKPSVGNKSMSFPAGKSDRLPAQLAKEIVLERRPAADSAALYRPISKDQERDMAKEAAQQRRPHMQEHRSGAPSYGQGLELSELGDQGPWETLLLPGRLLR